VDPHRSYTFGDVINFRDLGGYPTADGHTTRWGRLYRSSSLAILTEADRAAFASLGVRSVIDLRRPSEVSTYGRIPYPDVAYYNIAPVHQEWIEIPFDEQRGAAAFLAERYLELAMAGAEGYAETIRLINLPDATPAVVHCFAGKDRTGVFAALVLGILGVDDEVIAADYQLSEQWAPHAPPDIPAHLIASPAEAMMRFLDLLRTEYGTMSAYAEFAGLSSGDVHRLRRSLLD
jgi:hypothetical protein